MGSKPARFVPMQIYTIPKLISCEHPYLSRFAPMQIYTIPKQ